MAEDQPRSNLFVFYKPVDGMESKSWKCPKFPAGWYFVGSGGSGNSRLPVETQYSGPNENCGKMEIVLRDCHEKLKERGVIKNFRIYRKYPMSGK